MINVQVKRSLRLSVEKSVLVRAAKITLNSQNDPSRYSLSIVIGDEALIKSLNREYRHIEAPTDVLSFPSNEPDPDSETMYLGDVVISLPQAQAQASAEGHTLADELQLLVVHGSLHLLGFDHAQTADRKKMQRRQDEILRQLGLNLRIKL